ncbi:MAG TPA: threonine/serine dehydratase [Gemmatimonadaceae bacterium]|nr:threonine/serine dehydratase [Gemmatimonadaceae bacterium]
MTFPVSLDDALMARDRIAPYLMPTALRNYRELDDAVGNGIHVLVKHENHQPINSFKIRNALSAMSALPAEHRARGIVGATRGNHGLGLAHAGAVLGIPVTVVVPFGNNPDKNSGMHALGARLIESGNDYDTAVLEADRLCRDEGLTLIHSTNNRDVLAGAATMTLEILDQAGELDSMVFAVGGGSQATGAISMLSVLRPDVRVYGVQAEGASACYESWKAGSPVSRRAPNTIADGIATGDTYEMTFPTLRDGLEGFVLVSDNDVMDAMRILMKHTHNLVEPAGGAGLAGLLKLREELTGQTVCIVISGSNIDTPTLKRVLS